MKLCLNYDRAIISSLHKMRLKELAILQNDFVGDRKGRLPLSLVVSGINRRYVETIETIDILRNKTPLNKIKLRINFTSEAAVQRYS